MNNPTHIAMIPVMNAGFDTVEPFDFGCGAIVRVGRPQEVWNVLPMVACSDDITRNEAIYFQSARGWLWMTSTETPAGGMETNRNKFAICYELASRLWNLTQWIDLAGGGQNSHWRNRSLAGVYVYSQVMSQPMTVRQRFIYSTPCSEHQDAPWSKDCLSLANRLEMESSQAKSQSVPRLDLARSLRDVMTTLDPHHMTVRFQLCATALETLFIAPAEGAYLWNSNIQARVQQACPSLASFKNYFERFQQRRNDTVHRAGRNKTGSHSRTCLTEIQSEVLLREGLLWAYTKRDKVGAAFECDKWPFDKP